jgi:hypothetical protein
MEEKKMYGEIDQENGLKVVWKNRGSHRIRVRE